MVAMGNDKVGVDGGVVVIGVVGDHRERGAVDGRRGGEVGKEIGRRKSEFDPLIVSMLGDAHG